MENYCGANCTGCPFSKGCKGCLKTCGSPFGGKCIAAECIKEGGMEAFSTVKKKTVDEINQLNIAGMPEVKDLYCLCGSFVNLEYSLSNGLKVKFLKDEDIYLGAQLEPVSDNSQDNAFCFGVVASEEFILVCRYEADGANPEIILYKKR